MRLIWKLSSLLGITLGAHAMAASEVRLQPAARSEAELPAIANAPGGLAVSFGLNTTLPLGVPYTTDAGDFRYQASTGFRIELGYQLTRQIEIGVKTGYESYSGRWGDNDSSGADKKFILATVTQYPVEGIVHYRTSDDASSWAFELEAAAGLGFAKQSFTATDATDEKSLDAAAGSFSFLRGHVAAGVGFPWTEEVSFHLKGGFAFQNWGSEDLNGDYVAANGQVAPHVVERSNMKGVFVGADLRWAL